jgi:hypothetical protein
MAGGSTVWNNGYGTGYSIGVYVRKNGSVFLSSQAQYKSGDIFIAISVTAGMFYMAVNDYIEIVVYHTRGSDAVIGAGSSTRPDFCNGWLARIA